jgi:hypothetical protein
MKTRTRLMTLARLGLALAVLAGLMGMLPPAGADATAPSLGLDHGATSQPADRAATPGLPFTEDFSTTDLRDDSLTNANWSTEEQALVLAWRQARYGAFGVGLTGSNVTTDTRNTYSLALGDVDGDGDLDLVTGNSSDPNRLYLNDGSGTFGAGSDVSGVVSQTLSVALGDVDGDGDLDLVVGNYDQANRLYLNDGSGTFDAGSDVTTDAYNTQSVALGDVDGDGDLDLVAGGYDQPDWLYLNDGSGTFAAGSAVSSYTDSTLSVALGDVDGDGDLDLVAGNWGQPNQLYLNDGSGTFDAGSDVTTEVYNTWSLALGDVDGDGDLDLVAGNDSQRNRLYLNNGTAAPFSGVSGSDVSTDAYHTSSMALGDVDGDGDLDLVAGNSSDPNRLYLNDGSGTFDAGSDVTTEVYNTWSVALGDVDGDGDLDLVAGNTGHQPNRLYLNGSTANPFTGVIGSNVGSDTDITYSLALGDVDGDGDLDLVTGNSSDPNRLYLNDGSGTFGGGSDIGVDTDYTRSVALGDVDGDGDLDLVAGNDSQRNRLYLNDGVDDPFDTLGGSDITTDTHNTYSVALGDVDGDGDLDLVAGNRDQANRLYLNDGSGTFGAGSDVAADDDPTQAVALGDVDGDGDLDLVAGNYYQACRLYLNDGTLDPFGSVTGSDIATGIQRTESVALGDVDGDGDLDLVVGNSYDQRNRLYLNNGTPNPFAGVTGSDVSTDTLSTYSVALGDVDGDGDLDLVAGNDGANRLCLNNGTDSPFSGVSGSDITLDTDATFSVALGDVDGDGDLDLVAGNTSSFHPNRLYLNGGRPSPATGWAGSDITADAHHSLSVALGDVDGDGDLDLVAGNSYKTNRLYLNDGTASPFSGVSASDITTDTNNTYSVALGDVDGDGDLDLVVGNYDQANRLYLNDGSGTFGGGSDIGVDTDYTRSVALGDVDGDGDLDLVAGNWGQPNHLYLNDGSGTFGAGSDVGSEADSTESVALGDVDGDGDLDLVAGNWGQANRLYRNDGSGAFGTVSDVGIETGATRSVALGDVDGDGHLDLVAGNSNQVNRLYLNDGEGDPFDTATGSDVSIHTHTTNSVVLGDVDGDGDLDLATGNYSQVSLVYLNDGVGDPFYPPNYIYVTLDAPQTRSVALGDVDRDGDLDLVVGANGVNRLYRRELYHTAHGRAGSLRVDAETENIDQAMLTPTVSLPPNTHVTYYLSNNGGEQWFIVRPGVMFIFPTTGADLRWRAELHSLSPARTPRIDRIRITAQYEVYIPLVLRNSP